MLNVGFFVVPAAFCKYINGRIVAIDLLQFAKRYFLIESG